jgi:hypothetical protein
LDSRKIKVTRPSLALAFSLLQIARDFGIEVTTKRQKRTGAPKPPPKHQSLSREQSKEMAIKFAAEHTAPLKLLRDVKVIQFGTPSKEHSTEDKLIMMNYRARWTDAQSKVVFESRVEEGESGSPSYNVYVIEMTEEGKKLRYLVGKGLSANDIWSKVEERQRHAMRRIQSPRNDAKLSPVDGILARVSNLSNVWGLEKYGYIDLNCLKAMEGQDGVAETAYKYVTEREGWVKEQMGLRSLLAERGQRLRLSKPKDGQIERVVERLMESMLKKVCTWNDKYEAKLEKQKEREKAKLERQKEREQKQREKRLARKELNRGLPEDLELEGAKEISPPAPVSISTLSSSSVDVSQDDVERIVELWCLAYRFKDTLHIDSKNLPTLETMLRTYCHGKGGTCAILLACVDFLLSELCEDIVDNLLTNQELRRVDFIPPTRNARLMSATENSWPNVLHRYLYTVAIAAARWAETMGKKEDLNFVNYPLDHVHPYDVLDKITSGPTMLELATGEFSLMLTDESELRIEARRDALAYRQAAEVRVPATSVLENTVVSKNDKMLRMVLAKLHSVPAELGGGLLDVCFLGPEAALEARVGMPMDLVHVVSKVEALVYQTEDECLRSFASDVFFSCKMLDVACQKATGNKLGSEKVVARRRAIARWILQTLKEICDVYDVGGVDGVIGHLGGEYGDVTGGIAPRNVPPPSRLMRRVLAEGRRRRLT